MGRDRDHMTYGEYLAMQKAAQNKPSKYHAQPVVVDGIRFDSKRETARWSQLVLLQRAGEISDLRRQVPFVLIPKSDNGREIVYKADFVYRDKSGAEIVEDAKGVRTDVYRLKKRLMAEKYGIIIREV